MITTKPRDRARPGGNEAREYELSPEPTVSKWSFAAATDATQGGSRDGATPKPPKSPIAAMAILFLAAAGAFGYFAQRGHLVGEIASVVMLPCALHGVWRGGFRKTAMIAVTLGLFNLFWAKPDFAAPLVSAVGAQPGPFSNVVAAMLASLALWVTAFFIARSLQRRIITKNRFSAATDRFAGGAVGAAEGALIVLALCWLALGLRPYATGLVHADETVQGSARDRIGRYLLQIANEAGDGPLGQISRVTNPIDQLPQLRNAIDQLNTNGRLNLESIDSGAVQEVRRLLEQSGAAAPSPQ